MLMSECGYTPDYIDESMTLPRLAALQKYWARVPPVSVSLVRIGMALGIEGGGTAAKPQQPALGDAMREAAILNAGVNGGG